MDKINYSSVFGIALRVSRWLWFEMSIDFDKKTRDKRLEPGIISKLENLPTETRKNVNELPQGP